MRRLLISAALALFATSALAQTKISELPAADPLDGAEAVPVVQPAGTVKTTTGEISDYAISALTSANVISKWTGTCNSGTFLRADGSCQATSVAGAALTRTNDTNVTLTLGGAPTTALVNAASITAGWTGTLAVARGGTGASSLAAAGIPTTTNNIAFTPGCTGFTPSCPITSNSAHYSKTGNITCLYIQNFAGTSNSTNFEITGIPAAAAPVNNGLQGPSGITTGRNNATVVVAKYTLAGDGSGVITFRNGITATGTATWTNTGSKGLDEDFNFCYANQ